jgi:MADS-box transcription factor
VLCGAEVSILIFSNAGKPYEFSSRDLDVEVDRYLEYEGLIERRRGEEFAAMAEADEDDEDDDDEEGGRRASNAKGGAGGAGAGGAPKPTKSLKGKESFKKRMPNLREMARGGGGSKRKRTRDDGQPAGFIDGLVGSDEEDASGASSVSLVKRGEC